MLEHPFVSGGVDCQASQLWISGVPVNEDEQSYAGDIRVYRVLGLEFNA